MDESLGGNTLELNQDEAVPGIYFEVVIDYEYFMHRDIAGTIDTNTLVITGDPVGTFGEAVDLAVKAAQSQAEKFEEARVVALDDGDDVEEFGGFYYLIMNERDEPVGGVTIDVNDIRDQTIH